MFLSSAPVSSQNISYSKHLEIEDGLNDRIINFIQRDKFGFFYIFQNDGSIQQYDGKDFKDVSLAILKKSKQDARNITFIHQDERIDGLFLMMDSGDIFFLKDGSLTVNAYNKTIPKSLKRLIDISINKKININQVLERKDQVFLASKGVFYEYANEQLNPRQESNQFINCLFLRADKNGNLIAGFSDQTRFVDQLLVLTPDNQILDFTFLIDENKAVKDIHVDDIYDKWLIASYNGLYFKALDKQGLSSFYVSPGLKKSEFGNLITAINLEGPQSLFLKESDGIYSFDQNLKEERLYKEFSFLFYNNQKLIYSKSRKEYFSYSYEEAGLSTLYQFDLSGKKPTTKILKMSISDLYYKKESDELFVVGADASSRSGQLTDGLIVKYDPDSGDMIKLPLGIPRIRSIQFIDELKVYLLGTQSGFYVFDENLKYEYHLDRRQIGEDQYIDEDFVVTTVYYKSQILIGTNGGGIYVVDPINHIVVKKISTSKGLSDNRAVAMIEDDNGLLWVSTYNGLNVFDSNLNLIKKINEFDGLPNREFNSKAVAKDTDGNLFFGTLNGLVKVEPEKVFGWKSSSGLFVKDIFVHKGDSQSKLNALSDGFKHTADSITLTVSFPDYYKTLKQNPFNDFSIKSNQDVKITTRNDELGLSNFKVGDCDLKILDKKEQVVADFNFNVESDYSLLTKYLLLPILIILMVIFLAKYKIEENKKNAQRKVDLNNRIAELELTALRSQMNPHFIFNALGAIQYFVQTQNVEKADTYLTSFAKLMREILETSNHKHIRIKSEIELLSLYVSLEKMRFEGLFDYEIKCDEELDDELKIPPMIIQPFVENAINHGLYNLSDRKGMLQIHFKYVDDNNIVCKIIDNGIGRKAAGKFKKKGHISRGMQIVKDRVLTINSTKDMRISLQTIDHFQGNVAQGTEVTISVNYPDE